MPPLSLSSLLVPPPEAQLEMLHNPRPFVKMAAGSASSACLGAWPSVADVAAVAGV